MRACNCPNCGGALEIDESENKEYITCNSCGTLIDMQDFKGTLHIVDEARIQEDETKRIIKLKELELENKKRRDYILLFSAVGFLFTAGLFMVVSGSGKLRALGAIFWLVLICLLLTRYRLKYRKTLYSSRKDGKIRLTANEVDIKHRNYTQVQNAFVNRGFTNIEMVDLKDLKTTIRKKPGTVESITIEETEPYVGGWYDPEARVVITYHGMAE